MQWITAPAAILVDAVSFLVSAFFLGRIRAREPQPRTPEEHQSVWTEIKGGLAFVLRHPVLRAIAVSEALANLTFSLIAAVLVLYLTREFDLEPGPIGMIFAAGSLGWLVGAVTAGSLAHRLGPGLTIIGGFAIGAIGTLLMPLATGPTLLVVALLIVAVFLRGGGLTVAQISQMSVRQVATPEALLGRMNATLTVLGMSAMPVGAVVGGLLGEIIGLRATVAVGVGGDVLAVLYLWFSALRTFKLADPLPDA